MKNTDNECLFCVMSCTYARLCVRLKKYVFFFSSKQTIVRSVKVLIPFQDSEETCTICKTDFNDERNKITLAERGYMN